ncbi:hypothetical protein KEM54_000891 [Ascosphaera aggregata]|nr:hypothetical protein KEM54_000891 [Ascosphaera aggregata]
MADIATPLRRSARLRQSKGYFATPTQPIQTPAAENPASKNEHNTDATEMGTASPSTTPAAERIINSTCITSFKQEQHSTEKPAMGETSTTPMAKPATKKVPTKTPETGERMFKPGLEEMHPSKVQHSTTKTVDPGMVLGFKPIPKSPADRYTANTPSKSRVTQADTHNSESPDYQSILKTPTREHAQLSEEARQLMETIRKDAAKIEAEMSKERILQMAERADGDPERSAATRKIATPMGPTGRFSDAHMAQFRKMESIANHPSSHRPILPPVISPSPRKTLKRTLSKAKLEDETPERQYITSKKAHVAGIAPAETPAREKVKPLIFGSQDLPATPTRRSIIPRATTVYHPKVTKPQSPMADKQSAPRTPQTEFNSKFKTQIPELKSILRKRQPLFSTDPEKIAAGTHVPPPAGVTSSHIWDQKLYGLDNEDSAPATSPSKRVVFSPSAKRNSTMRLREAIDESSPSRPRSAGTDAETSAQKSGEASLPAPGVVKYPSLPPATPSTASASKNTSVFKLEDSSAAPSPKSPSIRASTVKAKQQPSNVKPIPTLHAAPKLPLTQHTPGQWPEMIPHGISNKKRHRDQVDDGEGNEENRPPIEDNKLDSMPVEERLTKRVRVSKEPTVHFAKGANSVANNVNSDPKQIRIFTANKASANTPFSRSTATAGTASSVARSAATTSTGHRTVPHTPSLKRFRSGAQPRTVASTRHSTPAPRRNNTAGTSTTAKRPPATAIAARRTGGGTGGISMSRLAALAQPKKR